MVSATSEPQTESMVTVLSLLLVPALDTGRCRHQRDGVEHGRTHTANQV